MKHLLLSAGLVLALTTTASANETFANPDIANGLSSAPTEAQATLQDCLAPESSSRAIRACSKVLKMSVPNDEIRGELYTRRALHRMALGRLNDAARDFERAADLKGNDDLANLGQGFAAILQKDAVTARARFEDCGHRGEVASLAQYGLGLTYQMSGEATEALAAYRRALDLRPDWNLVADQIATLEK